jgi:hypothetical protein
MVRSATLAAVTALALALGLFSASGAPAGNAGPKTAARSARRCPQNDRRLRFRDYPALHHELVPKGARGLIVCRYRGLNARRPGTLARSHRVTSSRRRHRVVRLFDALGRPPHGPIPCPADFGQEVLARFRYTNTPDDFVRQDLTGCRTTTNGHLTRWALSKQGSRLLHILHRVTAGR